MKYPKKNENSRPIWLFLKPGFVLENKKLV